MPRPQEYTEAELSRIRALAKAGWNSRDTAKLVCRPHAGLRYKCMVEGISFTSVRQPAGVQKKLARRLRRERAKK